MNSDIVNINQTLHGYVDGHTLISSSLDLPAEIRRLMLPLSDMSGSRMEKGFEEYITGYPLKQINKYALAKTWYASEMKRPGCVWTHTLLIDFSDLPKITNIDYLISLYERPKYPELIRENYSKLLAFDSVSHLGNQNSSIIISPQYIHIILEKLYNLSDKSLLIRSFTAYNFDLLFLMIWSQQWPRLKRSFSFCSGAIFPRMINGSLLDLQTIPINADKFPSIINDVTVVDLHESTPYTSEPWLDFAVADLVDPSREVKSFLNYFGSDIITKRSAFKSLVEAYLFFKLERPVLGDCMNFLVRRYPAPSEANSLKVALFGNSKTPFTNMLPKYNESTILYNLAITIDFNSFNYEKLKFRSRFLEFFALLNDATVRLLKNIIEKGPNPKGEEAIIELAEKSDGKGKLDFLWADKRLLSIFVGLNPRLTFNHNFWQVNSGHHSEIIAELQKVNVGTDGWSKILNILIDIKSPIDINILDNQNIDIEAIFLDYYNFHPSQAVGKNWQIYLKANSSKVLQWFVGNTSIKPHAMELIINLLNPNSKVVIDTGIDPWIQYLDELDFEAKQTMKIEVHVFFLALAFNMNDRKVENIFALCFEPVYMALAFERLDFQLWRTLEIHTKTLSLWRDWDRCKKIVNALVDHYVSNKWPIKSLTGQMKNAELSDRLENKYRKRK